jgi:hypothetical protein
MGSWIKKQITNIAIAMSNVEKNALGQESVDLGLDTQKHQRLNQNSVMDALIRGEVTEEVEKLRWRIYKTIEATKNMAAKVIGYDEDGYPIVETYNRDDSYKLSKVKTDNSDDYSLIMVVDNTNISDSVLESFQLDIEEIEDIDSEIENVIDNSTLEINDEVNNDSNISLEIGIRKTIGELRGNHRKLNLPINIFRELRPKFEIEKYTQKLHIKDMGDSLYLLEFYIPKYPSQFDKNNHFFISELKKLIADKRYSSLTDIKSVSFLTNNTIGAPDFLEYEYNIKSLNKIVEFNEYYVVKFISDIKTNGKSIIEQYRNVELDTKYEKKDKR